MKPNQTNQDHSGWPVSISSLPRELLIIILKYARYTGDRRRFVSCLLVCRQWLTLGHRLAWDSVVLDTTSLEPFLNLVERAPNGCRMISSLSLQIHTIFPSADDCRKDYVGPPWHPDGANPPTAKLWDQLERLAQTVRTRMPSLVSFSFRIKRTYRRQRGTLIHFRRPLGAWIRSSTIANLLEALPQSCIDLELDTKGREDDRCCGFNLTAGSAHLCSTLGMLLPRLRHLRFRLGSLCPDFFSHETNGSRIFIDAPRLESLLINMNTRPDSRIISRCSASKWTYNCKNKATADSKRECRHILRAAEICLQLRLGEILYNAYEANIFPKITGGQLINNYPDDISKWSSNKFTVLDIVRNQTSFLPFAELGNGPKRVYMVPKENNQPTIAVWSVLEDMIESERGSWCSSTEGDRWTTHFRSSNPRDVCPVKEPQVESRDHYSARCKESLTSETLQELEEGVSLASTTKTGLCV